MSLPEEQTDNPTSAPCESSSPEEETGNPTNAPCKSSSRERKLTEKGLEMQNHDIRKREKSFNKTYNSWKLVER